MKEVYVCYFIEYDDSTGQRTRSEHMARIEAIEGDINGTCMMDTLMKVDASQIDADGYYHPR